MKRILFFVLALVLLCGILPPGAFAVSEVYASEGTYDPYKAMAYAEENWDSGEGLCAEFVWHCVRAGGLNLSKNGLHYSPYVTAGVAEAACNAMGISFTGVKDLPRLTLLEGTVYKDEPGNEKLSVGDIILYHCDTCDKTPHAVICSGFSENGRACCYGHNYAQQNEPLSYPYFFEHDGHDISLRYVDLSNVEKTCECRNMFDIPMDPWYHDYIHRVLSTGLMSGVSLYSFAPEETMTRAMLVTVLWRYAGSPREGTNGFTDVPEEGWYTEAVTWAAENGIVGGVGKGRFDPEGNVTREQMATILYRFTKFMGNDVSNKTELGGFPDERKVSDYAREALSWAVGEGLVTGSREGSQTYLRPGNSATRAQVAAILVRYTEKYGIIPDRGSCGDDLFWELSTQGVLTISGTGAMWGFDEIYDDREAPWKGKIRFIGEIVIEEGVTGIGDYAFRDCSNVVRVSLPESLNSIGPHAFNGCEALEEIKIPENVTYIGHFAFRCCSSLKEVTVPSGIKTLETSIFCGCDNLKEIRLPKGLECIEYAAFESCDSLEEIELPDTVVFVGTQAFIRCRRLEKVIIGESTVTFDRAAFAYCYRLKALYFKGDAPVDEFHALPEDAVLYYIEGKAGWTSPTWNGYQTATWIP